MAHLRHLLLLFLVILLITNSSEARAASTTIAYDWSQGIEVFDAREHGEGLPDRMDIKSAYYGSDDNYHYFRIDVFNDPTNANTGDSYAFFLDTRAGGLDGGTGTIPYVPATLHGVDAAIGSSYIWDDGFVPFFSEADAGVNLSTTYLGKEFYDFGGKYQKDAAVLEWAIPKEELGNDLSAWAATYGTGKSKDQQVTAALGFRDSNGIWMTYDITSPIMVTSRIATPIPAAAWLLFSGMAACSLGRRKTAER